MSIRKVVAGLLITAGIAIMAVPFFWRATGEKQTEQLISEFDIVNIGLHFFHKDVRLYAASCSEV